MNRYPRTAWVKYNSGREVVDVSYGFFKPEDVKMFQQEGYEQITKEQAKIFEQEIKKLSFREIVLRINK